MLVSAFPWRLVFEIVFVLEFASAFVFVMELALMYLKLLALG